MKTFSVILFLISCTLAWAQGAEKGADQTRSCRIVFPERPNDAPKVAYLFDGKTSRQVSLPSANFSEVITLPPGEITILITPNELTDLDHPPEGAPTLSIAEGIRDFYIHVSSDPANSFIPLQLKLVDAGNEKLKVGETLWINLTDHEIQANLGETKMTAAPKGEVVTKAPLPESGYYSAEFTYRSHAEGDFQKFTEQNWWHDAGSRHLGFISDAGGRLPKIYFFRDFRLSE